jgi:hypothetical protein
VKVVLGRERARAGSYGHATEKAYVAGGHSERMDDGRLERFLRSTLRSAGEQYGEARRAYASARRAAAADIPVDDDGDARIVCRRHAERRAVTLDEELRPDCFDADHPDCEGCVEDVREGTVETW